MKDNGDMTAEPVDLFERAANFKPHLFPTDLLPGSESRAEHC